MPTDNPTLFLLCGKIAAGKSTLANDLSSQPGTVLISEDHWNAKLYPGEISTLDDYLRCSARLREVVGPHVVSLLQEGLSVVMDFPANTTRQREWLRGIFETAGVHHELHYLDVTNDVCKKRLQDRNAKGEHPFQVNEDEFDLVTGYFVPPTPAEKFNIKVHKS